MLQNPFVNTLLFLYKRFNMAKIPSEEIQERKRVPFVDMEFTPASKKKSADYCRTMVQSLYSAYARNKTELHYDVDEYFRYLRDIGRGRQSVDTYKKYFTSSVGSNNAEIQASFGEYFQNSSDANRNGWMSAIWDNLSPIANVKTIAKSFILKGDYDVLADVVDMDAMAEEDKKMIRAYVIGKNKPLLDAIKQRWGVPLNSDEEIVSTNMEDLKQLKERGAFKAHNVTAIQQVVKHIEEYSDWDGLLKEKLFDDVFDTRYAFAAAQFDPVTNKPKWIYVPPEDALVQYSTQYNFGDSQYFGWFERPSINKLRSIQDKISNGKKLGMTEDDWNKVASKYCDYESNPSKEEFDKADQKELFGMTSDSKVCVLHMSWIDYESEEYVKFTNPYGKTKMKPKKKKEKVAEGDEYMRSREQMVYTCSWIVGTDYVFDFGPMVNQPRINKKQVVLPFAGFKMQEKSYTERLAPLAHMFAIGWIRLCNAIAKAQNDFYYIDINALAEIKLNSRTLEWNEIIDMMRQENVLLGDSTRQAPQLGGTGAPIQKIAGTLAEDMMKEINLMDSMYVKIEQLTGLSPVALGSTPTRDQAVGTTEMSVSAANRALDVIVGGVMAVKGGLARASVPMSIASIKYDEEAAEAWARIIGQDDVDVIKDYGWYMCELGIRLKARPSEQIKSLFIQALQSYVNDKKQGSAGLTTIQSMRFIHELEAGADFLEILMKAEYAISQDEKRMQQQKEQMVQLQSQEIQKQDAARAQQQQAVEAMKARSTIDQEMAKAESQKDINSADVENDLKRIRAEWLKEQGKDPIGMINREQIINSLPPENANQAINPVQGGNIPQLTPNV